MAGCEDTAPDLLPVILDEVQAMREEVRHDLAAMRQTQTVIVEMVRQFGLRLHAVERRSDTPPPPPGNGG